MSLMPGLLDIFRALADPTRLRIVQLLRTMELAVGEIAQVVGQSQPRVSRHIRILVESGLVDRRKEGSWVFLRLSRDPSVTPVLHALAAPVGQSEALWTRADLARLDAVRADRSRAAEQYFAEHAEQWDAIRSLHIAEAAVEGEMRALLGDEPIGRLLDVGTGTGRMVQLFGPSALDVAALDRSPEMLRLARAKLPEEGADKYALVQGDFHALPLAGATVDTVIVHQVLHYAQTPAMVVAEAARVLAADGRLLIADFAPHDLEELRLRDQHARLGFSDDQVEGWFAAEGLELEAVRALPGKPLTVKLWLGRRRGSRIVALDGRMEA